MQLGSRVLPTQTVPLGVNVRTASVAMPLVNRWTIYRWPATSTTNAPKPRNARDRNASRARLDESMWWINHASSPMPVPRAMTARKWRASLVAPNMSKACRAFFIILVHRAPSVEAWPASWEDLNIDNSNAYSAVPVYQLKTASIWAVSLKELQFNSRWYNRDDQRHVWLSLVIFFLVSKIDASLLWPCSAIMTLWQLSVASSFIVIRRNKPLLHITRMNA